MDNEEAPGISQISVTPAETTCYRSVLETHFCVLTDLKKAVAERTSSIDEVIQSLLDKRKTITEPYETAIQDHEEFIRKTIFEQENSFKCAYGRATFKRGSRLVKWNDDSLLGYAVEHPEIELFRQESVGKPSVSISFAEVKV